MCRATWLVISPLNDWFCRSKMRYKHVFFDLDHTLWDFERNSHESLTELYEQFNLQGFGVESLTDFLTNFTEINKNLWNDFDHGRIAHAYIRENRFRLVFESLGVTKLPVADQELGEEYLRLLPQKPYLLDGAREILDYTAAKYKLHIVSNGFDWIQARKMASSGIDHYFEHVVTVERANAKKPDPQIFEYALGAANAQKSESIMIGDNWEADVMGAQRFGIDAVYYNPEGKTFEQKPTYDIQHLLALKSIL